MEHKKSRGLLGQEEYVERKTNEKAANLSSLKVLATGGGLIGVHNVRA